MNWNRPLKLKESIFLFVLVTACLIALSQHFASHATTTANSVSDNIAKTAQQRYDYDVSSYMGCITRQDSTSIGNKRAEILREFLQIAADARATAASDFAANDNQEQYKINHDASEKELHLKFGVKNTAYTKCVKPPVPEGVKETSLPEAPFNNLAN